MTQDLTLGEKRLKVRTTSYDSRFDTLEVKGLKVRTTLYDSGKEGEARECGKE